MVILSPRLKSQRNFYQNITYYRQTQYCQHMGRGIFTDTTRTNRHPQLRGGNYQLVRATKLKISSWARGPLFHSLPQLPTCCQLANLARQLATYHLATWNLPTCYLPTCKLFDNLPCTRFNLLCATCRQGWGAGGILTDILSPLEQGTKNKQKRARNTKTSRFWLCFPKMYPNSQFWNYKNGMHQK